MLLPLEMHNRLRGSPGWSAALLSLPGQGRGGLAPAPSRSPSFPKGYLTSASLELLSFGLLLRCFLTGSPRTAARKVVRKTKPRMSTTFPLITGISSSLSPHLARPGQAARQHARREATNPVLPRESERSGGKNLKQ